MIFVISSVKAEVIEKEKEKEMMRDNRKRQWLRTVSAALAITLTLTSFPGLSVLAEEVSKAPKLSTELWTPSEDPAAYLKPGDLTPLELQSAVLKEEEIPETIDRAQLEQNGSVNRLYEQESSLNSVLYQNKNGTKTLYQFSTPVKYKDSDGKIKDKSNELTDLSTNLKSRSIQPYRFAVEQNDIKSYYPQRLDSTQGVQIVKDDMTISMKPVCKVKKTSINSMAYTEAPFVSAQAVKTMSTHEQKTTNAVAYQDVYGADTILRYTPMFDGVKEDIILEKNVGIHTFTFELDTHGMTAAVDDEGGVLIYDPKTKEIKASISPIVLYDSSDENRPRQSRKNRIELKKLTVGRYEITMEADSAFLNDPETVYPVYVDPTLTLMSNTDQGPGRKFLDATMFYDWTTGPYGLKRSLYVGNYDKEYGTNTGRGEARTVAEIFEMSSGYDVDVVLDLKPEQVLSAKYMLRDIMCETSTTEIGVYDFFAEFTEATLVSNQHLQDPNEPGKPLYSDAWGTCGYTPMSVTKVGGTYGTGPDGTGSGYWYGFDCTQWVKNKIKNKYFINNIVLKSQNLNDAGRTFASREYGSPYGPRGIVTYTTEVPVTKVTTTTPEKQLKIGETAYLNATVEPSYATNKGITYQSGNSSVVTVDSNGKLTAKGAGSAVVFMRSKYNSNIFAECRVSVIDPDPFAPSNIESIRISKINGALYDPFSPVRRVCVTNLFDGRIYYESISETQDLNYSFEISQELINTLNRINEDWINDDNKTLTSADYQCHVAKIITDTMVQKGALKDKSPEYYGMWAILSVEYLNRKNQFIDSLLGVIQAITTIYTTYRIIAEIKMSSVEIGSSNTIDRSTYLNERNKINQMFDELSERGEKFSREKTHWITRTPEGRVVWLEEGITEESGFKHLSRPERLYAFRKRYSTINSPYDLSDFIYKIVSEQSPIRIGEEGEHFYSVLGREIKIVIGSNGYIVTAYPQ